MSDKELSMAVDRLGLFRREVEHSGGAMTSALFATYNPAGAVSFDQARQWLANDLKTVLESILADAR